MTCSFDGCDRPLKAFGLCEGHRNQRAQGKQLRTLRKLAPRGSGTIHKSGYRIIVVGGQRIMEHRHAMQEHLGRPLMPDENVHHVNGDRLDNRVENLELWNTSQPSGQRVDDKLEWARSLLREYAPVGSCDEEELW